jgi:hypothetical protein
MKHQYEKYLTINRFGKVDFMGEGYVVVDNAKEWVYQHDGQPLICDGCRKHVRYDFNEKMFYCTDPNENNDNFNQQKGYN